MASFDSSALINEGDRAILRKGKTLLCIEVRRKKKYQLEKLWFHLDGAIGQLYGSTFEAKGNKVTVITGTEQDDLGAEVEIDRDNRNLMDTSDNQKLDHEDIAQMRKEGLSGQNIIEQLVENSATFKVKTEYAQQKYLSRKKRKHLPQFQILKPSTRLLAEMYFNKGPSKICNLRTDSLAQMLTQGNVHAHNRMLVFETCVGLVTGAVMERMGGFGTVVQVHTGHVPINTAVDSYDFPPHFADMLHYFPVKKLPDLKKGTLESDIELPAEAARSETQGAGSTETAQTTTVVDAAMDTNTDSNAETEPPVKKSRLEEGEVESTSDQDKAKQPEIIDSSNSSLITEKSQEQEDYEKRKAANLEKKLKRFQKLQKTFEIMKEGNFDGLLVACRVHPTPVVLGLLEYVSPSRPVVVFSQYKEPLLDCYMKLRDTRKIANMRLTETWWRHYQVLPNRTHPEIQMNNYSGYLLTGITCTEK